jgi:hypothetical protein
MFLRALVLPATLPIGIVFSILLLQERQTPPCPPDMVEIRGLPVCVDRYEYPNILGVRPTIGLSALPIPGDRELMDAATLATLADKRLCTREEWIAACRMRSWVRGDCNDDREWRTPNERKIAQRDETELARLNQSEPSGSRATCRSLSGAYDMRGNAEEWVRCLGLGTGWCLMGRYWSESVPCEYTVASHSPRWFYYETGTRFCVDL